MNLWQVWLTPSDARNRSLSVVGVSTVSVVADSNGDVVGSHLVADLSRGLNHSLDNRVMSHSTNGGKGIGSMGNNWGMGDQRGVSVGAGKNHSRVGLSVPLDEAMGKGKSISKTMVTKTGIAKTSVAKTSIAKTSMGQRGMMEHREDRGVVDQGGGCAKDRGVSSNDSSISVPLDDAMGKGKPVAKTMVAKTGIAKTSVAKTSIAKTGIAKTSMGQRGMMEHREHRGVVDQGGGCAKDRGVSSKDSSISLPLAIVAMAKAIAVVANSDRDSVGSHLMADLSRGLNNRLDDRVAGNGTNRGKAESCGCSNQWGSGVWEGSVPTEEHLGVGGGRGNDC